MEYDKVNYRGFEFSYLKKKLTVDRWTVNVSSVNPTLWMKLSDNGNEIINSHHNQEDAIERAKLLVDELLDF